MGFGSGFKKFLKKATNWTEHAAEDTYNKGIKPVVGAVYSKGKPIVNQLYGDAKSVISTGHQDLSSIVGFGGNQLSKNYDSLRKAADNVSGGAGHLLEGAGKGIEGLGNALPYIIMASAGLGAVYLISTSGGNKRSRGQYSHSSSNKRSKYTFGLDDQKTKRVMY